MQVTKRDGSTEPADKRKIARCVERACKGLSDVDVQLITDEAYAQIYDGVKTSDIHLATVMSARARIVSEPAYSYAAARLLLHGLYREVFGSPVDGRSFAGDYQVAFLDNIRVLIAIGRFAPELETKFDLNKLADALQPSRDHLLKYLGVQTLYDRYINHIDGRRLETPQSFWMRVAMGLSLDEADPTAFAIELYEQFSNLRSCPATPTLLNSGKVHSQLSSCYVSTVEDSIDGIYGTLHAQARLSKYGGGLGIDVTPLRGTNSYIKGTNGRGQGLVPWAKQFNDMVVAVNQGGSRRGAGCLCLEPWHIDYLDFLDLKKGTGDERRRCHDLNTASWIPDEFMRRVYSGEEWYFFCPSECPDLHELFGDAFYSRYLYYIDEAEAGRIKNWQKMPAKVLWKKMLTVIKETGHPWLTWKDPSNIRYSNQHVGVVHSSQLCSEIQIHTKPTKWSEGEVVERGEVAVCNLHSINVVEHTFGDSIDWGELAKTVRKTVRALDNVIDRNYYPVPEARLSNLANRPVGLGIMGWADLLQHLGYAFDSDGAIELADELQEFISLHAILTSSQLAKERGSYKNFEGSLWSMGRIPIDTYRSFMEQHHHAVAWRGHETLDWDFVRHHIKRHGMRNSLVMAIAPTATISGFLGCSEGIGPWTSALFVYQTLSGSFTMFNERLVKELKKRGLWNAEMVAALQRVDGDVSQLNLPDDIKAIYKTAFSIDQSKLIDGAAARQKWIDQGQSLNLYYKGSSMKELSDLYFHAWKRGLKSTYYLHGQAASKIQKNTSVAANDQACPIDGSCQACQ